MNSAVRTRGAEVVSMVGAEVTDEGAVMLEAGTASPELAESPVGDDAP